MSSVPDPRRSRAVLIGTAHYETLPAVVSIENNLLALAEALCADQVWGLPAEHVAIVADPVTSSEMLDPLHQACDEATDTLLLYYAGHGLIGHRRAELHLALVGSASERIYTAVPYAHIRDALLDSRATRRIVVLDCCYSGRALGTMADPISAAVDEAGAEGTYILAASAENQVALAPEGEPHTAFTGELLTIFREGIAGCGAMLDLDTIYRHVRAAMRDKGRPLPQRRARNTAGDLALIRNPAHHRHQQPRSSEEPQAGSRPRNEQPSLLAEPARARASSGARTLKLEQKFHTAMVDIYRRAMDEADYQATYFLKMLSELDGLQTARRLLQAPKTSDGFTALWERGRLDLTVEAVMLRAEFAPLFSQDEREQARDRLEKYGYTPPEPLMGADVPDVRGTMSSKLVEEHQYDVRYHSRETLAAQKGCSWHGRTCSDEVISSVLVRYKSGQAWHAVCQRALETLRA